MAGRGTALGVMALLVAGGAVFVLARRAKASPPEDYEIPTTEIPTVDDIMGAENFVELDAYYNLANELFILAKIDYENYRTLYDAYAERWNELSGAT